MSFTVLLVEDDKDLQEALVDTISLAGYEACTANNGEEALCILQAEHIDLVVSDVQMARMDGIKLLKRIKSLKPELPTVLMTAFGTIQQAVDASQLPVAWTHFSPGSHSMQGFRVGMIRVSNLGRGA